MPLIHVSMLHGRSPQQKRRLLAALSEATQEAIGARPESVRVWITEIQPDEFMNAGETASERMEREGAR